MIVAGARKAVEGGPKWFDVCVDIALRNVLKNEEAKEGGVFYLALRKDVPATIDLKDHGSIIVTAQEDRERGPKNLTVDSDIKLKIERTGEAKKKRIEVSFLDNEMEFEECAVNAKDGRFQVSNAYELFQQLPKVYEHFIVVKVEMKP